MIVSGARFSDAARNLRQLRHSPVTWLWAGLILGIQGLVAWVGGPDLQPAWTWFTALGLSKEGFYGGKIWQIFSYGFLHGGWVHAGVNGAFVLLIGSRVEHVAGRAGLMRTMILGILGGGIGHLLLAPGGASAPLLVGLSGGCMALLLLLTTLSPQSRMMPLPLSARNLGRGVLVAELLLALLDPRLRLPGFATAGQIIVGAGLGSWFELGHACHLGGGLAGWLMGRWLLRPRVTLDGLRRDRQRREAGGDRRNG